MTRHFYVLISLFLLFITGCSDKELSRSKAESLIRDNIKAEQITINIFDGEFKNYSYHALNPEYNLTQCLADQGFISFENTGYSQFRVTLNPSIKPYVLNEKLADGGDPLHPMVATINLGKKSFKEITGIRTIQVGVNAIAEFNYEIAMTPVGQKIPENILAAFSKSSKLSGVAYFAKYDNGWRLERIENILH